MTTLVTAAPWLRIKAAAAKSTKSARAAVAYFGAKGDALLPMPKGGKLVVDASLGAVRAGITNPAALLRLHQKGVQVFTAPLLHAKVFAFDAVGFIGSTNASQRSAHVLNEAVAEVSDPNTIQSIRDFVESLAQDRLGTNDLKWLDTQYKPPQGFFPSIADAAHKRLVVQIISSDQRGYSGHQVQPPLPAWQHYFGLTLNTVPLPTFKLRNLYTGSVIQRPVVRHTQVLTIDIPEAVPGAIWEVRNVGQRRYDYRVVLPTDPSFAALDHQLHTVTNPLRNPGRLWFID